MNLPKKIYVRWTDPGNGELFLEATEDPEQFAYVGQSKVVGLYEITHEVLISAPVSVKAKGKKKP